MSMTTSSPILDTKIYIQDNASVTSIPPTSGIWNISDSTVMEGESIVVNGSIIIKSGGSLLINESTVRMNCPYNDAYNITVQDGGSLEVVNSTIQSNTSYSWYLHADPNSELIIREQSLIQGAGNGEENLITIQCDYAKIVDSSVTQQYRYNLVFISGGNHAYLNNNTISNSNNYGIRVYDAINATITNNLIQNTGDIGIYTHGSADYCTISHNKLRNIGSWGMRLMTDYMNITYNELEDISYTGIDIDYGAYTNITGNVIHDSSLHGIRIRSPYSEFLIHGNLVNNTDGYGLLLEQDSDTPSRVDDVSVIGNIVDNANGGALKLTRCRNNAIFLNALENETTPAVIVDTLSTSISWTNGSHGNYYSDYNGTDGNADGIGDQIWNITADKTHQDAYPLMNTSIPWEKLAELVYSPPEILDIEYTPEEPSPASYVNFLVRIDSPFGLEHTLFGWEVAPAGEIYSWYEMNKVGEYWNFTVPPNSLGSNIEYAIKCQSKAGEWVETDIMTYTITEDINPPSVAEIVRIPANPTHIDSVIVNATISDAEGPIDMAILSYSVDDGSWINLTMTEVNGVYTQTIPAQSANSVVDYKVLTNDSNDNWGTSSEYSYTVELYDVDGPDIFVSLNPAEPSDLDDVVVNITVSDASDIANVILSYRIGTSGSWTNLTATLQSGYYVATIPSQDADIEVFYKVYAEDTKGNWNVTEEYSYVVEYADKTGPSMSWHIQPEEPTSTDDVWVYATITDVSGIARAYLSWSPDDGVTWYNVTMDEYTDDIYRANTGQHSVEQEILFKIYAWDTVGNVEISETDSFIVEQTGDTTTTTTIPPPNGVIDTSLLLLIGAAAAVGIIIVLAILKKGK